jgi:hypothetical protein
MGDVSCHGGAAVSDDLKSAENTKPCAYCGSTISAKAVLCPVCKSYQSAWKTNVVYIAGIVGLITLIGSAITYIISALPNIHKILFWHDEIKAWKFSTFYDANFTSVVSNIGDGPVILSQIEVFY